MTGEPEVLIAAGLTAALLLARHGVPALVTEARTAPSPLPRARGVHSRAMEILRGCGVEADLRRHQRALRAAVMAAVVAARDRSIEMGR